MIALVWGCFLVLVGATILIMTGDLAGAVPVAVVQGFVPYLGEIVLFGFLNENYYVQLLQVLFVCCCWFLLVFLQGGCSLVVIFGLVGISGLFLIFILLCSSCNIILFSVVFLLGVILLVLDEGNWVWFVVGGLVIFFIIVSVLFDTEIGVFNKLSSGRIVFWEFVLGSIWDSDQSMFVFLFGFELIIGYCELYSYDLIVSAKFF